MPNIEQLDWDKLKPKSKDKIVYDFKKPKGYKKFDKSFVKPKKKKKLKVVDKTLWRDNYDQRQHLQSITKEQ